MKFEQIWEGRNCNKQKNEYFPATVPGNIQYDYGIAMDFGDVHYSNNYKQYIPLENDAWEYRAHLKYERTDGERVFFVSLGIDYKYDILLNGEIVYSYEGMYRPVELDLTDKLRGDDVLCVYVYPHPKLKGAPEGTRDEAASCCKPPVCYGWDWNPRLLVSGMWQEAYIETRNEFYIGNCEALTELNDDMSVGTVSFSFECVQPCTVSVYDMDGNTVYRGNDRSVKVLSPHLWWCNGQGEPYLYSWTVENPKQKRSGYIGFRKIRLVRNANSDVPPTFPKSRYDAPATIELNGRRILAKGSNWVNPELFWGQTNTKRYDELLTLVKNCNMNILRIWGGSGICKDGFYNLCDRYGIIVWQEFMLACNNYPSEEHYLRILEQEATAVIRKLRQHCCLGLWCGGNELFNSWSGMDDQSLSLRLLNKLCYELDPQRPFLATSPLTGMAHGGYRFWHDAQGGEVMYEFQHAHNTAYTEFGVPSAASVEILKKVIPEEQLALPLKSSEALIAHHGFEAWGHTSWLCPETVEQYFGKPSTLEEFVHSSNLLQCVGYQAAFEEMRKQWPHCSMMLNWCLNEPWETAANNSIISYPATPKPAYKFVKRALSPTIFSARIEKFAWQTGQTFEAELWLLNDTQKPINSTVSASIKIGDEIIELLSWSSTADASSNSQGPTVRCVLPYADTDYFILELQGINGTSNSYYLRYRPKKAAAAKPKILNQ